MKTQLTLAWRYLMGRKQRMILTTLAVVFGVTLLFGMNSVVPAMMEAFRHNMVTTAGKVDLSISSASNNPFEQSVLEKLEGVNGISSKTGLLQKNIIVPESMGGTTDPIAGASAITLTGLDVSTVQTVRNFLVSEGRFLEEGDGYAAVVPQILADQRRIKLGDTLTIPSSAGTADLKIVGILSLSASAGLQEVFVPLSTAQEILNLPRMINNIEILVKAGSKVDDVEASILSTLGSSFKSGQTEVGSELASALKMGESVMWLFGVMALAMAGFIIFNTFRTVIAERRRDLGMLRAIGASKQTVMGLILTESFIQGIVGTAIGLAGGYFLAAGFLSGYASLIGNLMKVNVGTPVITATNLIGSIILGIGFTVGSGYFPARSAMKITPMEALRPALGSAEFRKNTKRAWIGGGLILVSLIGLIFGNLQIAAFSTMLFLVGLIMAAPAIVKPIADLYGKVLSPFYAREARLAQGNLARQPSRAAITASAMMIGLAICIALLAMITSVQHSFMLYLDRSLGTDYLLMPPSLVLGGGNLGANTDLIDRIRELDGVEAATSLRLGSSNAAGSALQIIGIDPLTYEQISGLEFSQGDAHNAFTALNDERAIIINGMYATTTGVKPGDEITLKTANGDQVYKVVGVAFDYLNAKILTGYVSQANLEKDFNSTSDMLLLVNHKPEADGKAVLASMKTLIEDYPAFTVIDSTEFKNEQMNLFKTAMSSLYALVILLALPGLIAMANTMSINILERTREIGMLRAVGSTQDQVKRMVFAESLLLSGLGTSMGIAVGLFLSYLMLKGLNFVGFTVEFFFPLAGVLTAIAVGFAFGIIAAMVPARQAARTLIVEALRYE